MSTEERRQHLSISTPGETLASEFMYSNNISVEALARALHLPAEHVRTILQGKAPITQPVANRLAAYFVTSEVFWLNLQADYERRTSLS